MVGRPRAQGGVCPGALRTLETQQDAALRQLREDLQSESSRHVRDLEQRLRDQEAAKQLEVGGTCVCVSRSAGRGGSRRFWVGSFHVLALALTQVVDSEPVGF